MKLLSAFIPLFLALLIAPCLSSAKWVPPAERARARQRAVADRAEKPDVPSKWFRGARGFEDAQALQTNLQADIFIYFIRPNTPNEKGLCSWFDKKGLRSRPVKKLLREYIKVVVTLPANPKNQALAKKFFVNKTPAVFVIQPDGWRKRLKVFKFDEKPIKLLEPEELEDLIRACSSEKYHLPKSDEITE